MERACWQQLVYQVMIEQTGAVQLMVSLALVGALLGPSLPWPLLDSQANWVCRSSVQERHICVFEMSRPIKYDALEGSMSIYLAIPNLAKLQTNWCVSQWCIYPSMCDIGGMRAANNWDYGDSAFRTSEPATSARSRYLQIKPTELYCRVHILLLADNTTISFVFTYGQDYNWNG